jgi:Fe-S cluster assembly protein SufD
METMSATMELSKKDQFLATISKASSTNSVLTDVQNMGTSALQNLDFPTSKTEDWKYTRVGKITKGDFSNSEATIDASPYHLENLEVDRLVFINGHFDAAQSNITSNDQIIVSSLLDAMNDHPDLVQGYLAKQTNHKSEVFTAINTGYFTNGVFIYVKANAIIEKPVHIINIITGENSIAQTRNLIVADKSSQVKFISTFESTATNRAFSNTVTEVMVMENAEVAYDKLQYEDEAVYHIGTDQIHQEQNSRFTINTVTLNGGLVRNSLNIIVDGENCETNLYGLYLLKNKQHVDNHSVVDHKKAHCESNELYKGMIDDQATGVFNGKVYVRPDAQKINAFQSNANILMTDDANINSKPELEIYADDVKCSHGSTTGQFDEEAVFYLRSRGIGEDNARKLLVAAFASDVLDNIKIEPLRTKIDALITERFDWRF